mgnify:CR=1 FL=1
MKETFFEYNMHELGYVDEIMKNSLIILDTNVLLNLYRFNKENREKFFEILEKIQDRLFLTYQSGKEFYKNRLNIIDKKIKFKDSLKDEVSKELIRVENKLINCNFTNDTVTLLKQDDELKNNLLNSIKNCENEINKIIEEYNYDIIDEYYFYNDPILKKILNIFEGKINKELSEKEKKQIYEEGKNRYIKKIPPGYEDKKTKQEPDCYGDLIIWNEMINISKDKNTNVLFISNDTKEDWLENFNGKTQGPRKELIKEFKQKTNHHFYAITDSVFIQKISELHNIKDIETLKKESENIQNEMDNSQEAISHFFTEYYELQTLVRNFAYFDRIHEIVK